MRPLVACIGTTDPWNAAGLGLDVRVLAACGARALIVVAGVSAQDRDGVHAMRAMDPALIVAQLASLANAPVLAYRVGALLDVAGVEAVAHALEGVRAPVIYDPVLGPTTGPAFANDDVVAAIARTLLPRVTLVTPNAREARALVAALRGERTAPRTSERDAGHHVAELEARARSLVRAGAHAALVTDGDREPNVADVLVDRAGTVVYEERHIAGGMRGTGCALAGAIAASLAGGAPLRDAVAVGRAFVRHEIARAVDVGGMRVMA